MHEGDALRDQYVPYIRPQESGAHTDTRWCMVSSGRSSQGDAAGAGAGAGPGPGAGFAVASGNGQPFQYSFTPFSDETIAGALHDVELPYPDLNHDLNREGGGSGPGLELHVDSESLGLGGDDSWSPRVHAEYVVDQHRTWGRVWGYYGRGGRLRAQPPSGPGSSATDTPTDHPTDVPYSYEVRLSPLAGRGVDDFALRRRAAAGI